MNQGLKWRIQREGLTPAYELLRYRLPWVIIINFMRKGMVWEFLFTLAVCANRANATYTVSKEENGQVQVSLFFSVLSFSFSLAKKRWLTNLPFWSQLHLKELSAKLEDVASLLFWLCILRTVTLQDLIIISFIFHYFTVTFRISYSYIPLTQTSTESYRIYVCIEIVQCLEKLYKISNSTFSYTCNWHLH